MTRKFVAVALLVLVAGLCFQVRGDVSNIPASSLRNSYLTNNGAGKSIEGSITAAPRAGSLADSPFLISQIDRTSARQHHRVTLSWDPSIPTSAAGGDVIGYNVYRRTRRANMYSKLNGGLVLDTTYVDDSVDSGEIYYYETTAVNSSGIESRPSNRVRVKIVYP
jgi:hypothetical protein